MELNQVPAELQHKMDPAVKAQWLEALRSGKYTQTTGVLRSDAGFCCLGVLCDLLEPNKWGELDTNISTHFYPHMGTKGVPNDDVSAKAGFEAWSSAWNPDAVYRRIPKVVIDGVLRGLDEHNDAGKTFEQIAQAIEEQL